MADYIENLNIKDLEKQDLDTIVSELDDIKTQAVEKCDQRNIEREQRKELKKEGYRLRSSVRKLLQKNDSADIKALSEIVDYSLFSSNAQNVINEYPESNFAIVCFEIKNIEYIKHVYGIEMAKNINHTLLQTVKNFLNDEKMVTAYTSGVLVAVLIFEQEEEVMKWFDEISDEISDYSKNLTINCTIELKTGIYMSFSGSDRLSLKEMVERTFIAVNDDSNPEIRYTLFDEKMFDKVKKEAEILRTMDEAMGKGEFKLYLQPQHHIQNDDKILSAEALVRWIKDDGTVIYPDNFIPVFEKNNCIAKLDRYMIEKVCDFIASHKNDPWYDGIKIAVNVSQIDLNQPDFIDYYTETKQKYSIDNNLIEIEFTESAVFDNFKKFKTTILHLKENGFSCALDDFGAGSSSLNVLKQLPVDILKMDKLFFDEVETTGEMRDNVVISSVVNMGKGLGLRIVAEGIEKDEQVEYLREIGCEIIQGYVYSKPLSEDDFVKYVKNFNE